MAELRTLARPYAKAAFHAANDAGKVQLWADQLTVLGSISSEPRVADMLGSSTIEAGNKVATLASLAGGELDSAVENFLAILSENKRLPLLGPIAELFAELKANQERTVEVNIKTAFSLDDSTEARISQALKDKLQREIKVHTEIDRSLIGGVLIRAGDIVIDDSIKGRLAKLAEAMAV